MQNAYQTYFKDRSLYYATFPIREQASKGDNWNFKLQHVYVHVEIAKFNKSVDELETNFDKWLYVLQNLSRLDNQPKYLQDEVSNRLFSEAEIARFSRTELKEYEDSLKAYRDIKNSLDTAKEEGTR